MTGLPGGGVLPGAPISAQNSLVGASTNDSVGSSGIFALSDGNYAVLSGVWDAYQTANVGAVTWADGETGLRGFIDSFNSVVGSTTDDRVGGNGLLKALPGGEFFVLNRTWDRPGSTVLSDAGAVFWAKDSVSGPIVSENSALGPVADAGDTMAAAFNTARQQLVVGWPQGNRVVLRDRSMMRDGFE